jgi:hypothetical protein
MMLACLVAGSATAQSRGAAATAPLLGIFDGTTGDPLVAVQVRDEFSGAYALTTATGTVRLSFITFRGAASFVRLMKLGYGPKTILVAQGDTAPITEVLERVTTLGPIVTTERYRLDRDEGRWNGFSRRCAQHTVTCFGDTVLAANAAANMADLLVKARGVTIGACGTDDTRNTQCGRVAMRSSVIPPAYCEPSIFVDGFWWNPHITSAIDMQPGTPPAAPFTPGNVKGVEVYQTNAPRPLRFEGDPFCGAIVIWTK